VQPRSVVETVVLTALCSVLPSTTDPRGRSTPVETKGLGGTRSPLTVTKAGRSIRWGSTSMLPRAVSPSLSPVSLSHTRFHTILPPSSLSSRLWPWYLFPGWQRTNRNCRVVRTHWYFAAVFLGTS